MAKKEIRKMVTMECTVCGMMNVHTERNSTNTPERLSLNKYCRSCRKHQPHKEKK